MTNAHASVGDPMLPSTRSPGLPGPAGLLALLMLIVLPAPGIAQTAGSGQAADSGSWVDYASGAYEIFPNITYATANNTALRLDLYLPNDRKEAVPVLVLFHGGGWVAGMKERNVFQLLPYLSMGWAVINVEYRLGNSSPAPAAVEDCRCALRWVVYNSSRYNLDTSRIVLTGGSSGGHLALITGMLPAYSEFDRQCPVTDDTRWTSAAEPPVRVAAIVNWYGISDVAEIIDGPNAKHYAVEWFGSIEHREDLARRVSPITYVRPGLPAIITLHGDRDDIVPYDQSVRLHAALEKAGVPNRLVTVRGAKHGGFGRKDLVSGFAAIRDFLRKNNILKGE